MVSNLANLGIGPNNSYRYNIFIVENLTPPVGKTIETHWR